MSMKKFKDKKIPHHLRQTKKHVEKLKIDNPRTCWYFDFFEVGSQTSRNFQSNKNFVLKIFPLYKYIVIYEIYPV